MKNSVEKFSKKIYSIIEKISIKQEGKIRLIAKKLTDNYKGGGSLYIFGTGHNHCIAEEGLHRSGAFAGAIPILDKRIDFALGITKASKYERNPRLAKDILKRYSFNDKDSIIIFSNSGVNQLSIEVAKILKNKHLFIIVVTSKLYSDSLKKNLKSKLYYYSDVCIDNYSPIGDTLFKNHNFGISSSSSIVGIFILNSLWLEMSMLLKKQEPYPFYKSSNLPGSKKHNIILQKTFRLKNKFLR
jgi:uncharacterized phosphosugar-binding protein